MKRLFAILLACGLHSCAGCACAPDRWTVTEKTVEDAHSRRWSPDEVDISLSGPIPPFRHDP